MIRATVSDLPRMETAAREFYALSRFLHGFDMARFVTLWTDLLEKDMGVIFAVENGAGIHGAIGGVVYPEPYSGDPVATEFFWFIKPEHRGSGLDLYRAFELWARKKGCKQIRMVHLMDLMPGRLAVLYRRLGFEAAEMHYVKELR